MMSRENIKAFFEGQIKRPRSMFQKVFMGWYQLLGFGTLAAALLIWWFKHEILLFFLVVGIPYTILWIMFKFDFDNAAFVPG
jgi:hypothetical protein